MSPAMDSLAADKRAARERRIDYVEFASIDPDASRAFFEQVFGWQFQAYGPDYLAFNDGRLDGGFYRATAPAAAEAGPLVVLYADELAPAPSAYVLQVARSSSRCSASRAAADFISASPVARRWRCGPSAPPRRATDKRLRSASGARGRSSVRHRRS